MGFDLSWFTTVPGLFITGGVILLIVALVILIVTNKKSKKEKAEVENNAPADQNAAAPTMAVPGVAAPVEQTIALTGTV